MTGVFQAGRRKIVASAALLVFAATAAWWVHRESEQAFANASLPPVPVQADAELAARIGRCETDIRRGAGTAPALAELAAVYHANGYHAEAATCYRALIHLEPKEPRWPYRLACILIAAGRLEDAESHLLMALVLAPGYQPGRLTLADTLARNGRNKDAVNAYNEVLKHRPGDPQAIVGLARIDVQRGALTDAITRLEQLETTHPGYAPLWELRASLYERAGRSREAADARARELGGAVFHELPDPWMDELLRDCLALRRWVAQAEAASTAGDPIAARALLEQAVALAPNDAAARGQLGKLLLTAGDAAGSRVHLEAATRLAPAEADHWVQLLACLRRLGEHDAATRALAAGLSACPRSPRLRHVEGLRLATSGALPQALAEFETASRLRPTETADLIAAAQVQVKLDRNEAAVKTLQRALTRDRGNPSALVLLTRLLISGGEEREAVRWFERARQEPRLSPDDLNRLRAEFQRAFGRPPHS